jgi:hypothetical protein
VHIAKAGNKIQEVPLQAAWKPSFFPLILFRIIVFFVVALFWGWGWDAGSLTPRKNYKKITLQAGLV